MERSRVHLQGLDLRTPDTEATPGACRVLHNLYPTGDIKNPTWKSSPTPGVFLSVENEVILSACSFSRSNAVPLVVYLRSDGVYDRLFYRRIDVLGNTYGDEEQLYPNSEETGFSEMSHNADRRARFAQVGDNLVIAITIGGEGSELLVVSTYENTLVCFPFNIPISPVITITPEDYAGEYGTAWGYRCAWELLDGSFVRMGDVTLRRFDSAGCDVTITGTGGAPNDIYKKIIRGIAVFSSTPGLTDSEVLDIGTWHKVGMVDVWANEPVTFTIPASDATKSPLETIQEYPEYSEELLNSHSIYTQIISSYNKLLLFGGARYDFALPQSEPQPQGTFFAQPPTPTSWVDTIPDPLQPIMFSGVSVLHWRNPTGILRVEIEGYLEVYFVGSSIFGDEVVRWGPLICYSDSNETSEQHLSLPMNPLIYTYRSHLLGYKIRAIYPGEVPSQWVPFVRTEE